jgi:ProP effector
MTGIPAHRLKAGTLRLGSPKEVPASLAAPTTAQPAPDPADAEERAQRKAENLRQERELQRQARVRHAQQTNALLAELRTRWPHLFTSPVPLAKGINKVIAAEMGSAVPPRQVLGRALSYWTQGGTYLEAIAAGTRRVALDGLDAGEPTEDERQHAREVLAQRKARRQGRACATVPCRPPVQLTCANDSGSGA